MHSLVGKGRPFTIFLAMMCLFFSIGFGLAHFLSRCGETSKNGALCLRQFNLCNHSKDMPLYDIASCFSCHDHASTSEVHDTKKLPWNYTPAVVT